MEEFDREFNNGIKRNVWLKVTAAVAEKVPLITQAQVINKWKALKRTYKSILLNNNTSGQRRRHWQYFTVMHNFLFNKPDIVPVATCSSRMGMEIPAGENGKCLFLYLIETSKTVHKAIGH